MGDIDGDVGRKRKREEAEKAIAEMEARKEQEKIENAKSTCNKKVE